MNIKVSLFLLLLLFCTSITFAGNVDPDGTGQKYSWGENIGWTNLSPALTSGVTVEDDRLKGYMWNESTGWIKLDPQYGGVAHDGQGNLSGYAWSENTGWINISCTTNNTCNNIQYGVTINLTTGKLTGYAWGENIGWLNFDYSNFRQNHATTLWRVNGDVNSSGVVTLEDLVLILQACSNKTILSQPHRGADTNNDNRIGLEEAVYILQRVSN